MPRVIYRAAGPETDFIILESRAPVVRDGKSTNCDGYVKLRILEVGPGAVPRMGGISAQGVIRVVRVVPCYMGKGLFSQGAKIRDEMKRECADLAADANK